MGCAFHLSQCGWRFVEREHRIDHRFELSQSNGFVHDQEIGLRSHVDTVNTNLACQDWSDIHDLRGSGQDAYLGHRPLGTHGFNCPRQSSRPADFHDQIDTFAAGFSERPLLPVGVRAVIESGIEAKRLCAFDFFVAAGYSQHSRPGYLGELKPRRYPR